MRDHIYEVMKHYNVNYGVAKSYLNDTYYIDDSDNEKINYLINEYVNKNENILLSLGIIVNGKKYYFNFGNNVSDNIVYDYEIGSISKTFTAHLVMKYVELNKLDLFKSVGDYLNIGENYPTIYELLTHTSGYKFLTPFNLTYNLNINLCTINYEF